MYPRPWRPQRRLSYVFDPSGCFIAEKPEEIDRENAGRSASGNNLTNSGSDDRDCSGSSRRRTCFTREAGREAPAAEPGVDS